jgi:SUKH-3 immunity protein
MESHVKEIAENAGWYEGRKIDVEYMLEDLKERGFTITNPHIVELLKEFWNLNLEFLTPSGRSSNIRLNIDAATDFDRRDFVKLSEWLHDELIPVGSIHEECAILLLSHSEKFYMMEDSKFYKIGDSLFEALSTIINEKDVLRIV